MKKPQEFKGDVQNKLPEHFVSGKYLKTLLKIIEEELSFFFQAFYMAIS